MKKILTGIIFVSFFHLSCSKNAEKLPLPNILWITSEDNSPFAGCYGDDFATTPNMDKLASKGFLYTHAYANAPVCAPARNTIITGVYANSGGHQNMRSNYNKSDIVRFYPRILREAGYYCTNSVKEDFNVHPEQNKNVWDASSRTAHYKDRPEGMPFFAIFNSTISHESSLHTTIPAEELRHKPEDVTLPPYHPDTPEIRHDWAQYYDKVEDMDSWIGTVLQELEESGEAENTIIFYYGDHGGTLARSKRYVYETGTRVPFIVYIPEKYKHLYPTERPGSEVNRIISFVDLVPTLLSITGIDIPEYLQGNAFLGKQKTADPEYAFMFRDRMDERFDMSRALRDHKFRYIRNYMPYRIYGQYLAYLWRAPSIRSWEAAYKAGQCNDTQSVFWNTKPAEELYDTENDPWEISNLAANPEYSYVLERMRNANRNWMLEIKDTGFFPEGQLVSRMDGTAAYDYMRNNEVQLESIIDAAELASLATKNEIPELVTLTQSEDATLRYWGATGLLILGTEAKSESETLRLLLEDASPNVATVAAEALYNLGEKSIAQKALIEQLQSPVSAARNHVLNSIDCLGADSKEIQEATIALAKEQRKVEKPGFDLWACRELLKKWDIDPEEHGLKF
jgi:N-sulfoglucosamine sulfohydrolase